MTFTTLNLTLTNPQNANLIRKYGTKQCHIKHLPLGILSLCKYLYTLHIRSK